MCVHTHNKDITKVRKKRVPYTINLDWLEVTVKQKNEILFLEYDDTTGQPAEVVALANDIHLERQKNKSGFAWKMTKSYGAFYSVYWHGEEVAQLQTIARFKRKDLSQIKILNHLLYTNRWRETLEAILEALQVDLNNFTPLDIAIDGRGFIAQHLRYREGVIAKQYKKVGRAKTSIIERGQYECEGFNVGTRRSGKYLTGYSKGALIQDAKQSGRDHKPYIVQFWQDNGLISDPENIEDVERLEMKLTSQRLNKITDLNLDKIEAADYLAGLFQTECENFYQWVKAGTDTNTTRAKDKAVIHAIKWHLLKAKQVVRKTVRKCKNALWNARRTISHLMREYYVNTKFSFWETNNQAESHLQYCRIMAERYGISDWFNIKLSKWENDHEHQQAIKEAILAAQFRAGVVL